MTPLVERLVQALKLSFKRKTPIQSGSKYPLSLTAAEWRLLKEAVDSPAWAGYKAFLEHYAEVRAQRLLQPLSLDQTNVERGAVAALFEVAALPEALIKHKEQLDARERDSKPGADDPAEFHWGSPYFADQFRAKHNGSGGSKRPKS